MTLAIGSAPTPPPPARGGGLARDRLHGRRDGVQRRLAAYRGSLKDAPASVSSNAKLFRLYDQSLLVLAASEDKTYRGASIAAPSMAWIWGTLTLEPNRRFSGPYHLVWPRDLYHVATAQRKRPATRRRRPAARLPLEGAEAGRLLVAEHARQRDREVDERAARPGVAPDRPRLVAGPHRRDGLGARRARPPTTSSPTRPSSDNERWENQDGYSPNTIATEIAGLICRRHRAGERRCGGPGQGGRLRGARRRVAAEGRGLDRDDNGPYAKPYYLRVTKDGNPDERRHALRARRQLRRRRPTSTSGDRRQLVPRARAVRRQEVERPDGPQPRCGRRRARATYPLKVETPSGPVWHRFTYDGYGEQRTGTTGTCSSTTRRQTRGACGRC